MPNNHMIIFRGKKNFRPSLTHAMRGILDFQKTFGQEVQMGTGILSNYFSSMGALLYEGFILVQLLWICCA